MSDEGATLGAARRIKSKRDFDAIYGARRSIRNRNLTFCWRRAEGERSRLGLSVGRRIGNAVERNRVKRVLREVFRREAATLSTALDIIIIPRGYRTASSFEEMLAAFRHLVRKLERELDGETEG